ncbi:S-adenosyl-L-methionine-dependent methyltransferase, partial [Aspergillus steynii IBT 23096]
MQTNRIDEISSLSEAAFSSLTKYQTTGKNSDRLCTLQQLVQLTRALEKPADTIYRLFLSPTVLMAINIAIDIGVFEILAKTESFVTSSELIAGKQVDKALLERIMRVLVMSGFAGEHGSGQYFPTQLSKQITVRTSRGTAEYLFKDFLPIIHKTPVFLKETQYRNPLDPTNGPFQYTYNTQLSCWGWLAENPDVASRFNTFMEGNRGDLPHWSDWFPVQSRLVDGADGGPFLVDVAGGRGHDLLAFKKSFPRVPGALVLEDLPSVIADIRDLDPDIRKIEYDFFTPQPVQGARAYYFKHVLHDWSDENCRVILKHTKAAMRKRYSKLLIEEHVMSDRNPCARHTLIDMGVMLLGNGMERTRSMWMELLESMGFTIQRIWAPVKEGLDLIEAELGDYAPQDGSA